MATVCVILDSQPPYLQDGESHATVLTLPLGRGSVVQEIAEAAALADCADIRVCSPLAETPAYLDSIRTLTPHEIRVTKGESLASLVREYEPSDNLVVIDPRFWPIASFDLRRAITRLGKQSAAVHRVSVQTSSDGAREYVHCDDNGQVMRILRYYENVTCSAVDAIEFSIVPLAAAVANIEFATLVQLRSRLSNRGIMSRDEIDEFGVIDLHDEQAYLALNEQRSVEKSVGSCDSDITEWKPGVFVGQGSKIAPDVELVEPLIIQNNVEIEAGATVIGPSVIGAGCRIGAGATVAQSVMINNAELRSGDVLYHRVAHDHGAPSTAKTVVPKKMPDVGDQLVRLGADASAMREIPEVKDLVITVKLWIDRVIAGLSLVILSPLLLLTAIAVKLDSPGPAMFGHEREGLGGKVFRCLKFRTMVRDAHQKQRQLYAANKVDGPQFKLDHDPRVTRVGKILRATNIDELPQLINVLLGQMALVGPRPSPFRENQICVPWRRARLSVRPGITGLWQICRDQRSEGDFHQWITYDIMYVRNLSLWLDAKIIAATVFTLGGMSSVPHHWLVHDTAFDRNDSATLQISNSEAA